MNWMYSAQKVVVLPRALHGHTELRVGGNWDRNICWEGWQWNHGLPHLGDGGMGEEISTHIQRKACGDGQAPCSMPEGQCHRLRAPAGSLPADASAVDMDLYDAQTLAEALKWYLQELPSPLVPPALYSDLVHMAQGKHGQAPPVPGTFVRLEELWEAPTKALQHLQGSS